MKKFAGFLLRSMGWKIEENYPRDVKQCVIVVGPHTTNWDFVIGRLAFAWYGIKTRILVKKDLFFPPMGWFLRWIGCIPVNRSGANNMTDQAAELFKKHENLFLVFTPEGTRKQNPNWKKGFYYIALKAQVPIYVCYMDYSNKTGGFKQRFDPTGDVEKDIEAIKDMLRPHKGKYPENGII